MFPPPAMIRACGSSDPIEEQIKQAPSRQGKMKASAMLLLQQVIFMASTAGAFVLAPTSLNTRHAPTISRSSLATKMAGLNPNEGSVGRGEFLSWASAASATTFLAATLASQPAGAVVRGNAPPPGYNKRSGAKKAPAESVPEDTVVDEDAAKTFSVTKSGVRYKDLKVGTGSEVKPRNVVGVRYRVEKLGKRSYDGISGETQSIFSLGYGEDDDKEGDVLTVPLGMGRLVSAVDEAIRWRVSRTSLPTDLRAWLGLGIHPWGKSSARPSLQAVVGMRAGGVRRVAVRPERGWKKIDPKCATEIDMGVMSGVPGAALAKVEDCIDLSLEPKPVGYGATRRMARRFDETLIVEVEMVNTREGGGNLF